MALCESHERYEKGTFCHGRIGVSFKNSPMQKKSRTLREFCSRPGILVLINDADWELEGEDQYEIQAGDNIVFVSTLHGG